MSNFSEEVDPLLLSDVLSFMPPLPDDLDSETSATLMSFRTEIYQRRVKKVNEFLPSFKEIWPKGTPIELFLALEKSNDDFSLAIHNISTPHFLREINKRINTSRPQSPKRTKTKRSELSLFYDEDSDDQEWSYQDIEHLKQLVNKYGNRFKEISKHLKGKTPQMCKNMYEIIKLEIAVESPKKKKGRSSKFDQLDSITFIKNQKRYIVGQNNLKYHELESVNPLPGYLDQLTLKPMRLATLSPDGYVLDYDTWIKLLKEQKVNPFTQNKIKTQRELIILTQDNFNQYKDMIVNLENIKPIEFTKS